MKKMQGSKTPVTIIRQKDNSTLVQYVDDGVLTRKYVPTAKVIDGFVPDEVLEQGISYGYPWEEIELKFDSRQLADEMHQVDLWTVEDVLRSPQKVQAALNAILANGLSKILDIARNEKKGVKPHG